MRSWLAIVVAVVLFQDLTSAHAARPRLGVFQGRRVNNTIIEGKAEAPEMLAADVRLKVRRGRLYVTMTPPGCKAGDCWVQSFKVMSDMHHPGVGRFIDYKRDANPRAKKFNEAVFARLWGPAARLVDMTGSGTVIISDDGKGVRWVNMGKGTMLVTEPSKDGPREVSGQTSWSETFAGRRPGHGSASALATPVVAP